MDKKQLIEKVKYLKIENDTLYGIIKCAAGDLGDEKCNASIRVLSARSLLMMAGVMASANARRKYREEGWTKMTRTETLALENKILKSSIESARAALVRDNRPVRESVSDALRCLDYEIRLEKEQAKEECIWILTFQDGYMQSIYGTRSQAEKTAERLRTDHGNYKIA